MNFRNLCGAITLLAAVSPIGALAEPQQLVVPIVDAEPVVDGDAADWASVTGISVPMSGKGGVASVEIKASIHGDRIYMLAIWSDATNNDAHKPYVWDAGKNAYSRTRDFEDRLAVMLAMSGEFSPNKLSGAEMEVDVWHWKAARSNPAGVAHDKHWIVSKTEFPKSKKFRGDLGDVFLARKSDAGDKLYRADKPKEKTDDRVASYKVTAEPKGSIADVAARGVWSDGKWVLEMSRLLDTGNDDDAVIPANGGIAIAIAAFDGVGGKKHSVSETVTLVTGQ